MTHIIPLSTCTSMDVLASTRLGESGRAGPVVTRVKCNIHTTDKTTNANYFARQQYIHQWF